MRVPNVPVVLGIMAACNGLTATSAVGQQELASADSCVARIAPRTLHAGITAVEVTTRFPRRIGRVTGVEIPEESGIELTRRDELQRLFASRNDGRPPRPIEAAPDGEGVTLWLDLLHASAGEHAVVLHGQRVSCTATLRVD